MSALRIIALAILCLSEISLVSGTTGDCPACDIYLQPDNCSEFETNNQQMITYNLSASTLEYIRAKTDSSFFLGITYEDSEQYRASVLSFHRADDDATIYLKRYHSVYHRAIRLDQEKIDIDPLTVNATDLPGIKIYIRQIGHVSFSVDLLELFKTNTTKILTSNTYLMTAIRKPRLVDTAFNAAVTILGILNTCALGCVTDIHVLKQLASRKSHILLSVVTQYILMPLVIFGFLMILRVQNELFLGLLFLSCVPGGGLGYLIISITGNTDMEFSSILNFIQILLPMGAVPLYVFSIAQHIPNGAGFVVNTVYYLVFWLLGLLLPFTTGLLIRRFKQSISDAFLNWLIKPLLLLAFILFITLGLYINMYMFGVLPTNALAAGALIPFIGFGLGGGLMLIFRQGKPPAKTLAIEAAITNSVVVIVALRFTLPQPDADLASAAAMWVLFFTPVPFILMFIFHRIKRKIMSQFEKKEFEKAQAETMKSSFAAITQNAMQMGGISTQDFQQMQASSSAESANNPTVGNGDRKRLLFTPADTEPEDTSQVIINNCSYLDIPDTDIELQQCESSNNPLILS